MWKIKGFELENTNNLGEILVNGQIFNLKGASTQELVKVLEDINMEQNNIKQSIFNIIENF